MSYIISIIGIAKCTPLFTSVSAYLDGMYLCEYVDTGKADVHVGGISMIYGCMDIYIFLHGDILYGQMGTYNTLYYIFHIIKRATGDLKKCP